MWRLLASLLTLSAAALAQSADSLVNLSARVRVVAGGAPLIAGFVLQGTGSSTVLVRAVGPGLAPFGVAGIMGNPRLTVFDARGAAVINNDDWGGAANVQQAATTAGAFVLSAGSLDAAVAVSLTPGSYTVQVTDADAAGGVVLVELYLVNPSGPARLANLSVRATTAAGAEALTAGFVLAGSTRPILVRGIGPGLAAFGVAGAVANPQLAVLDAAGSSVAVNDDWDATGLSSLARQTATEVGAFPLLAGSRDAATVVTLAPGAYTVRVAGAGVETGQALVEIYAPEPETAEINGALRGEPGNIQDNVFQSLCIDPTDSNTVYIGTETNGIFKTTDGGATWTRLRQWLRLDLNRVGYPQIYEIAVDPTNPRTIYAATVAAPGPATGNGVEVLRSGNAGVYKSTDGGLTWRQRINGFSATYTPHVVLSRNDSRTLYAGIGGAKSFEVFYDGGLMISRDGADSWQPLPVPAGTPKNTPVTMLATTRNGTETLYVSYMVHGSDFPTAYGLFVTSDAGRTWESRNPDGLILQNFDVFARDNAIVYANDDTLKRIHKSVDGGRTWTRTPLGNFGPIRISPADVNTVLFTGFTTLMKSSDGLNTQRTVLDDTAYLGNRQFMDIKFAATDPRIVWAAAKGYILYKSTDGGESFTRITAVRVLVYGAGN